MNFRNISAWSTRNPVVPIVLFIALTLAGIVAFMSMKVQGDPDVEFPGVIISISQPGAAPTEIETQITQRIESAVRTISGVSSISSTAREGNSTTVVEFQIGTDINEAVNESKNAIDQARSELPDGILEPQVVKMQTSSQPIGYFAVAADDMTTHLINVGHRRIGFIKGHPNHMASDERLFGYRRALDRAGIAYEPSLVCDGEFDFESGVRAANLLLDLAKRPTAIFASNDDMAAGVLAVAHDRGIDLPAALSVAGFDDTTLARTVWPPLTTIHQPMAELARTATDILITGGDISHRRLPHTLVERGSVAPPPRKDTSG